MGSLSLSLSLFSNDLLTVILYVLILCLHVCLFEGIGSPRTLIDSCVKPCGCGELNHGPLEKQLEEHLQPPEVGVFKF